MLISTKKPHPCGSSDWEVIRMGADVKIKCVKCGHVVEMKRAKFEKAKR